MSTHNICIRGEIRKIPAFFSDEKSTMSVAMIFIFVCQLWRLAFYLIFFMTNSPSTGHALPP